MLAPNKAKDSLSFGSEPRLKQNLLRQAWTHRSLKLLVQLFVAVTPCHVPSSFLWIYGIGDLQQTWSHLNCKLCIPY